MDEFLSNLNKVVYSGNRCFLPVKHELRGDTRNFPGCSVESREKPTYRNFQQDVSFHKAHDGAKNKSQSNKVATGTGCRGMYMLARKMPGFDRVEKTMPDAMHTVAVQVKHLHRCLAGKAPEDSLSVRKQEMSLNRFPECWPTPGTEEAPQAGNSSKSSDSCRRGKKNKNNQKKVNPLASVPA